MSLKRIKHRWSRCLFFTQQHSDTSLILNPRWQMMALSLMQPPQLSLTGTRTLPLSHPPAIQPHASDEHGDRRVTASEMKPPGKTCCAASEGRAESGTAVHAARSHPDRKHYHSFRLGLDRLRPTRPVIYATFLCVCSQNVERLIKIFTELKSRSGLRLIIPDFKLCFLNNFQPVLIISGKNVCGSQMIKDAAVTFLVFLKPL